MPEAVGTAATAVLREAAQVLAAPPGGRLPVVTLSWAETSAGAIARADGAPLAVSGPESLLLTHTLRSMHDAIMVGIATVLSDDPLLSVRLIEGPQPQPVVLDSRLRIPAGARILSRKDVSPWIFHAGGALPGAGRFAARELARRGVRLFPVSRAARGLDLREVLRALAAQGIRSVMVEGGARVLASFLAERLAVQAVITVSPVPVDGLPGPGVPPFASSVSERQGADTVTWGLIEAS